MFNEFKDIRELERERVPCKSLYIPNIYIYCMVNYFVEKRKNDKTQLLETIKAHPDMDINKLLGLFSLKTGLRVELLKTYYEELKQAGVIEGSI